MLLSVEEAQKDYMTKLSLSFPVARRRSGQPQTAAELNEDYSCPATSEPPACSGPGMLRKCHRVLCGVSFCELSTLSPIACPVAVAREGLCPTDAGGWIAA